MTESTEHGASSVESGKTSTNERTNLTKSVTKKKIKNKKIGVGIGASIVALLIIILPIIIMKLKKAPLKTPKVIPLPAPAHGPIPSSWYTPNKNIELPEEAYEEIRKLNLQIQLETELFFPEDFTARDKKYALMAHILGVANEMEGLFPDPFINEQTAILNRVAKWAENPPEKEEDFYKTAALYVRSVHDLIQIEKKFHHHQDILSVDLFILFQHLDASLYSGSRLADKFPENPYAKSLKIVENSVFSHLSEPLRANISYDHKSGIKGHSFKRMPLKADFIENTRQEVLKNPDFKEDGVAAILLDGFSSLMNQYK